MQGSIGWKKNSIVSLSETRNSFIYFKNWKLFWLAKTGEIKDTKGWENTTDLNQIGLSMPYRKSIIFHLFLQWRIFEWFITCTHLDHSGLHIIQYASQSLSFDCKFMRVETILCIFMIPLSNRMHAVSAPCLLNERVDLWDTWTFTVHRIIYKEKYNKNIHQVANNNLLDKI